MINPRKIVYRDPKTFLGAAIVTLGEREATHGDVAETHERIAELWGAYLGLPISPEDVAWMMLLLKAARAGNGQFNPDNYVDAAAYAGIAGHLAQREAGALKQRTEATP